MDNQPNKTADFREECWTPSPLEGILSGHFELEAHWVAVCRVSAAVNDDPESSFNGTKFQSDTAEELPSLRLCCWITEKGIVCGSHLSYDRFHLAKKYLLAQSLVF